MKIGPFVLVLVASATGLAQSFEYDGPSILSRAPSRLGTSGGELTRLRPFAMAGGSYASDLATPSVDASGSIPRYKSLGVDASWGVSGAHQWRRTLLGLDYRGDYGYYTDLDFFNGTNQAVGFSVRHLLSRRLSLDLRVGAGSGNRMAGNYSGFIAADPDLGDRPLNELFDSRVDHANAHAGVMYALNARDSLRFYGQGFVVGRHAPSLVDINGYGGGADFAHRLSRASTVGVTYHYQRFGFLGAFGGSEAHSMLASYGRRLGRYWEAGFSGGAVRTDSHGVTRVALNPAVAALLGQTMGVEAFQRVNIFGTGSASLSRNYRRSSLRIGVSRGLTPGNGIYLAAAATNASVSYTFTAPQKWNAGFSGGYNRWDSVSVNLPTFGSFVGGAGASRQLVGVFHLSLRYDIYSYAISGGSNNRLTQRASVSIAVSPGDYPLSLW